MPIKNSLEIDTIYHARTTDESHPIQSLTSINEQDEKIGQINQKVLQSRSSEKLKSLLLDEQPVTLIKFDLANPNTTAHNILQEIKIKQEVMRLVLKNTKAPFMK